MIEALATGSWLTEQRAVRVMRLALAATIISLVVLFATASGTIDRLGRPLGTDFSDVWAAGWMADHGQAAAAWNWRAHYAVQQATHHRVGIPFYGWHYPPPFLLIAALLAKLPYLPALVVWQLATLIPTALLVRRIVPAKHVMLATLAAPVVLVCLGHGHNGFLTAGLLGGGLLLLDRRPWLAGALIGCLAYKPQFALLLPLVLLVGGHWRALAGAAAASASLVALTMAIWGWSVWRAFLDSLPLTQHVVIEQGATGWEKIQSAFAAIRMWGGSVGTAYTVQTLVTLGALLVALVATRRGRPFVRNAAVLAATLLSTPYVLDYDFVVLGIALAFVVADGRAHGFRRWEVSLLALAWATPLFGRQVAAATLIPCGLITTIAVLALAARRIRPREWINSATRPECAFPAAAPASP